MKHIFLNVKEVAQKFSVTRSTVYRWLQDPNMNFPQPIKIGHATRWDEDELNAWVQVLKEKSRGTKWN